MRGGLIVSDINVTPNTFDELLGSHGPLENTFSKRQIMK